MHDINYNPQTQQHSFMSTRQKAWHGLGQIVDQYPTSAEAMRYAGLDFTVEKLPNTHILPSGQSITSANSFYTYRSDTEEILGDKLGNEYEVVQNAQAFDFFDSIVGGGTGIKYETAGALGKGERIFITAKLPDFIKVGRNDLIEKYLFLTTSHDGYGSITAAFTPVRIVCANTLSAAMGSMDNCVRIRHTQSAQERLKQAHTVMGITNRLSNELDTIFNRWAKVRITDKEVKRLVEIAMSPSKEVLSHVLQGNTDEYSTKFSKVVDSVTNYAFSHPTQLTATTEGTLFGAYNAITGYYQNVKTYKDSETKLKNIMFGGGSQRALTAYNLCTNFEKQGVTALQLN
jgi:phage/plasmid-like protein (TIGR03299 family)